MRTIALCVVLLLQASLFFVLPSIGTGIFLSPDETANAVSARLFSQSGQMRFTEPLLREFPWMHPRSFVTQNATMVPVGFLGMPILLGIVRAFVGEWSLVFVTPLLALSVIFPLWRFMARVGRAAQIATVLTWLSFPTVILYANRGLFANLPVVCLTVWACFLLWELKVSAQGGSASGGKSLKSIQTITSLQLKVLLAGLVTGVALAMRPMEILWIVPWLAVAWRCRQDRRAHFAWHPHVLFAIGTFIPLAIASYVAWKTYGSPFTIGYFLRDPIISATSDARLATSYVAQWPFGFHPRNVLFNLMSYFGKMLWPWTIIALAGIATLWKRNSARPYLYTAGWTIIALTLVYGQAIYQDHVGVNVISIGNSFVRYLLPLAVFISLTSGYVCTKIISYAHGALYVTLLGFLAMFGTRLALMQDAEGIIPARRELRRYHEIRDATVQELKARATVFSERSDKIFFPPFRVASPIPDKTTVRNYIDFHENMTGEHTYLFTETLNDRDRTEWERYGVYVENMKTVTARQALYRLKTNASEKQ